MDISRRSHAAKLPASAESQAGVSGTVSITVDPVENVSELNPDVSIRRLNTGLPQITLVVPCYNEEGSLPYLARTLEHLGQCTVRNWDLRCIFVDDCSRDNTHEVLQACLEMTRDVKSFAMRSIVAYRQQFSPESTLPRQSLSVQIDCDCSYDPMEIPRMLSLMKPGIAMVTASPYHPQGEVRNVPRWRLFLSHSLSVMYRILLGRSLSTWTSCFRVYRRSMILDLPLRETGFLGTAELAGQLSLHDRRSLNIRQLFM